MIDLEKLLQYNLQHTDFLCFGNCILKACCPCVGSCWVDVERLPDADLRDPGDNSDAVFLPKPNLQVSKSILNYTQKVTFT